MTMLDELDNIPITNTTHFQGVINGLNIEISNLKTELTKKDYENSETLQEYRDQFDEAFDLLTRIQDNALKISYKKGMSECRFCGHTQDTTSLFNFIHHHECMVHEMRYIIGD